MTAHAAGLLLPLFALALGGLRNPWAFTAVALLLWGASSQSRLPRIPAAPLWGGWLLWSGISAAVSAEPWRGLSDLAYRAAAIAVFLLALNADKEAKKVWRILVLGAIPVLELCAVLIDVPSYPNVGVLYPYYNYTGAAAAAGAAFGLAVLISEESKASFLGGICAAASWAFLFWAGSRGGLVAAAAGSLVVLIRSGRGALAGASAAAAAIAVLGLFLSGSPLLKLERSSANLRPKLWKSALAVASESPLLGEGPGQFDRGFLRHNFPAAPDEAPTRYGLISAHAHSELLQEAAETGWPGALLLGFAVLLSLTAGWRRTVPEIGALGACAALLAHGLFDNIFALPGLEWMFFSSLGAMNAGGEEYTDRWPRPWIAAGILLTGLSWVPRWIGESARSQASEPALRRALSVAPKDPALWADLARVRLRDEAPRAAVEALVTASRIHPTEAVYPLMIAQIARSGREWKTVLRLTDRALELEPAAPQPRLLRAQALLELRRPNEARAEFEAFQRVAKPLSYAMAQRPHVRFILGYEAELARALEKHFSN